MPFPTRSPRVRRTSPRAATPAPSAPAPTRPGTATRSRRRDGFTQVVVNLDEIAGTRPGSPGVVTQNGTINREGYYLDDIVITGEPPGACTTGASCTDPGAPSITGITDDDACAQDGVTINYSRGQPEPSSTTSTWMVPSRWSVSLRVPPTIRRRLPHLRDPGGGSDLLHR